MPRPSPALFALLLISSLVLPLSAEEEPLFTQKLNVNPPPVKEDASVKYDYDIVYVRARRAGDKTHKRFYTDFSQPVTMEPGADLMLLHPDGSEELLVEGGKGSITDPVISFDGEWAYYVHIYNLQNANQWSPPKEGADIFKIHLKSRRIVRLTNQRFVPNTGAANWAADYRKGEDSKTVYDYGVFNMGPHPLPGGKIVFTSNREGYRPSKGYPAIALQLFVMDDRDENVDPSDDYPANIEKIGHLNIAGALHPVALTDGRIMFSSLESQGIRSEISWGIWTIHPDGTNWGPLVSAFDPGGASNGFHFQTQLSDGSIIIEEYYNQNNSGFGAYLKMPPSPPKGYSGFGPANMRDPRNVPLRFGRFDNGKGKYYYLPFMPTGAISFTPFALNQEGEADRSVLDDKTSPKVGKFTHPSGAPDNHMLTIWSPGPVNHQYTFLPQLDGGIYLIKDGKVLEEPGQMRLVKNDPNYNESWPRAVVPYKRIYGIEEPATLPRLVNDGSHSPHLPSGTPFGLVGTSSFYKRESYPNGSVPEGKVTAEYVGKNDPWKGLDAFTSHGNGMPTAWHNQGGDVGLYDNAEIHAVRILVMEPTTDRKSGDKSGRQFYSHAMERLRILGELPLRKFAAGGSKDGQEPLDPDGNPDTSFLAKIPADLAFTFQTLDKDGLVLNTAQTWHQLRPGETRSDCGGCHAHSQKPTDFSLTLAAKPEYKVFDLTEKTALVSANAADESKQQWDTENATGLRYQSGPLNVEYHRDVRPILARSCVACHTAKDGEPAGNLVLDDEQPIQFEHHGEFPGTYYRLAVDERAKFGHKPVGYDSWGYPQASRYIRKLQSRRSLLTWKIFGKRLDGFSNDDHPSESKPGAGDLVDHGKTIDPKGNGHRVDVDFVGSIMPPPDAVAAGKVAPLTDEDRRTLVRWIDLGCPLDRDYNPAKPQDRGRGWMLDDQRPTLTLTSPQPGKNGPLTRILIGMTDAYTGLDSGSLSVTAEVPLGGAIAGEELSGKFKAVSHGVWEWRLDKPIEELAAAKLDVSVKDKQGNTSRIVRTFSVAKEAKAEKNPGALISPGNFPTRVHVAEDYETEIERRWWLRGKEELKDLPEGSKRACRAVPSRDFDDKQGDAKAEYKAVVFNPVPGPPMRSNTRLSFKYKLHGTDTLRVQLYSLTNNYHRCLSLQDLPQDEWQEGTVDMTQMRRPDGSGGPLSADERIDDIQFYIDPNAELLIDDIVLYDAAAKDEKRLFPNRILFIGWFDTGKQGEEWPGTFEIVPHDKPRTWKCAKSVPSDAADQPGNWIRVGLRGERQLGEKCKLTFGYYLSGNGRLEVELYHNGQPIAGSKRELIDLPSDKWSETTLSFDILDSKSRERKIDEVRFAVAGKCSLRIDDVLLYQKNVPATK
jgi:hypothetical protein